MRTKRAKAYRKLMNLYSTTFGFREPYQVLLDSSFVQDCLKRSHDIEARLSDVLQGKPKIMISQCCVEHLYKLGASGAKAINLAKTFERRKCNHWEVKESDGECIKGLIGTTNNARYIVATQSSTLRNELRKVPGVPLIYLSNRSVVLLEPPSEATIKHREKHEKSKMDAPRKDTDAVNGEVESVIGATSGAEKTQSTQNNRTKSLPMTAEKLIGKRKRSHAPNPLSVKKKKPKKAPPPSKSASNTQEDGSQTKKRRRGGKKKPGNGGEPEKAES